LASLRLGEIYIGVSGRALLSEVVTGYSVIQHAAIVHDVGI